MDQTGPKSDSEEVAERAVGAIVRDAVNQPQSFDHPLLNGINRTDNVDSNKQLESLAREAAQAFDTGTKGINQFFKTHEKIFKKTTSAQMQQLAATIVGHLRSDDLYGLDIARLNVSPEIKETISNLYGKARSQVQISIMDQLADKNIPASLRRDLINQFRANLQAGAYAPYSAELIAIADTYLDSALENSSSYNSSEAKEDTSIAEQVLEKINVLEAVSSTTTDAQEKLKELRDGSLRRLRNNMHADENALRRLDSLVNTIDRGMKAATPEDIAATRQKNAEAAEREFWKRPLESRPSLAERDPALSRLVEGPDGRLRMETADPKEPFNPLKALDEARAGLVEERLNTEALNIEELLKQPFRPRTENGPTETPDHVRGGENPKNEFGDLFKQPFKPTAGNLSAAATPKSIIVKPSESAAKGPQSEFGDLFQRRFGYQEQQPLQQQPQQQQQSRASGNAELQRQQAAQQAARQSALKAPSTEGMVPQSEMLSQRQPAFDASMNATREAQRAAVKPATPIVEKPVAPAVPEPAISATQAPAAQQPATAPPLEGEIIPPPNTVGVAEPPPAPKTLDLAANKPPVTPETHSFKEGVKGNAIAIGAGMGFAAAHAYMRGENVGDAALGAIPGVNAASAAYQGHYGEAAKSLASDFIPGADQVIAGTTTAIAQAQQGDYKGAAKSAAAGVASGATVASSTVAGAWAGAAMGAAAGSVVPIVGTAAGAAVGGAIGAGVGAIASTEVVDNLVGQKAKDKALVSRAAVGLGTKSDNPAIQALIDQRTQAYLKGTEAFEGQGRSRTIKSPERKAEYDKMQADFHESVVKFAAENPEAFEQALAKPPAAKLTEKSPDAPKENYAGKPPSTTPDDKPAADQNTAAEKPAAPAANDMGGYKGNGKQKIAHLKVASATVTPPAATQAPATPPAAQTSATATGATPAHTAPATTPPAQPTREAAYRPPVKQAATLG